MARQTARVYRTVLKKRSKREGSFFRLRGEHTPKDPRRPSLTPESFRLKEVIEEIERFRGREKRTTSTAALIVVGHQPQLTQFARELLKRGPLRLPSRNALPGGSLPLGNSEAACIRLGYGWCQWHRPRLLWLLTEKGDGLLTDLKDKIKSKYDVAKFFLGAFVVNIGLFLNAGIWDNINFGERSQLIVSLLAAFDIIMALASLGFAAATLFSYDSLLMPASLWSEPGGKPSRRDVRKPRKPPKWSVLRPPAKRT